MRALGRPTFTHPHAPAVQRSLPPLLALGVLALVGCAGHEPGSLVQVEQGECASCHADQKAATTSPPHVEANFPDTCGDCHVEASWTPAPTFQHTSQFALTLGHEGPTCTECHTAGYKPDAIPNQCADCHADRAAAVVDPVHNGLVQDCFACHRTDAFFPAYFVHSWPLDGLHTLPSCGSCHPGNPATYEGTSTACVSCHADDKARADANVEGHAAFPDNCEGCHTSAGF